MAQKTKPPNHHFEVVSLWLMAVVVFVITTGFATQERLAGWESSLFKTIYGWSDSLHLLFIAATLLGTVWMVAFVVAITAWRRNYKLSVRVLLISVLAFTADTFTKLMVQRPRPADLLTGIVPRVTAQSHWGFPSGHTTMVTAVATVLWPYTNGWQRAGLMVAVSLVGLSRIYLGVHAPLDVIGGVALGLVIGLLPAIWLKQRKARRV